MSSANGKRGATMTILGLGSLLSERSARTTFPELAHFRLVQLHGYRRVFAHTPALFVRRGIADASTLEMASLSAEECEGCGFVCTAFEVVDEGMDAFNEREEESKKTCFLSLPKCRTPTFAICHQCNSKHLRKSSSSGSSPSRRSKETDPETEVPVAEVPVAQVPFPELTAVRCSAWARRTAHTWSGGGASGGSGSTCRVASPPSGSGPKPRRSDRAPRTCAIACSRREGQFQKSQKKGIFCLFLNVATPLLPYVINVIQKSFKRAKKTCFLSLPKCRTPTFAICHQCNSKKVQKSKKKTCFRSLPKCRTPTFAICHTFNSQNPRLGPTAEDSFLDETYLVDRKTTIREYLAANPHIMTTLPPPDLQERYGG